MGTTVMVTGATSGLGRAAALLLAQQGHAVVAVVRDRGKGMALVDEVAARGLPGRVELVDCDLASLPSVHAAVDGFTRGDYRTPDVMVCNAGVQVVDGVRRSEQGYELTMAVNVLAHQQLIGGLAPQLGPSARVILLGSATHRGGVAAWGFPAPRWNDPAVLFTTQLNGSSGTAGRVRYANSKLAAIYLTTETNRRFGSRGVTANTFDPGLMPETQLDREYPAAVQRLYRALVPLIVRGPGARRVTDAAADLAWLATAPEPAGWTNEYVYGRTPRTPSALARHAANAQRLWKVCDELGTRAEFGDNEFGDNEFGGS